MSLSNDLQTRVKAKLLLQAIGQLQIWLSALTFTHAATPPKVTFQSVSLKNILPGRKASFSVQATGTLPLNYQWQWKQFGKESEQDEWQNLTSEDSMLQEVATELKLASVQGHNAGHYRCVVSNCAGSSTSQCARVTVGKHSCNKPL